MKNKLYVFLIFAAVLSSPMAWSYDGPHGDDDFSTPEGRFAATKTLFLEEISAWDNKWKGHQTRLCAALREAFSKSELVPDEGCEEIYTSSEGIFALAHGICLEDSFKTWQVFESSLLAALPKGDIAPDDVDGDGDGDDEPAAPVPAAASSDDPSSMLTERERGVAAEMKRLAAQAMKAQVAAEMKRLAGRVKAEAARAANKAEREGARLAGQVGNAVDKAVDQTKAEAGRAAARTKTEAARLAGQLGGLFGGGGKSALNRWLG